MIIIDELKKEGIHYTIKEDMLGWALYNFFNKRKESLLDFGVTDDGGAWLVYKRLGLEYKVYFDTKGNYREEIKS